MIPSLDTYVHDSIDDMLKTILKHEHIVNQTLANIDSEARNNFIKMYCGNSPKSEIDVTYSFPQGQQGFHSRIVVQLGSSTIASTSIGDTEATFSFRELGTETESTIIQDSLEHPDKLEILLSNPVGELMGVDTISFSTDDNVQVEGNKILFTKQYNETLIGMTVKVTYTKKGTGDPKGAKKGFTTRDSIRITPMSTNMDIARCLDALLKVVMVMMRESIEENTSYLLQGHEFGEMQQLAFEDNPDNTVYGRTLIMSYTVTNTIDFDFITQLKEIILHKRQL